MNMNFVPECYFDTTLVKAILGVKKVNHQKGCATVVKEMRESKLLKSDFAVGIIDKDKRELDYIKDNFKIEINSGNLILLKHKEKPHYIVQVSPAIEKWILNVAEEGNIDIGDFGLPTDLNKLCKYTKTDKVDEDPNLIRFCQGLVNSESKTMRTLTLWLQYLFEHNRDADVEEMKKLA